MAIRDRFIDIGARISGKHPVIVDGGAHQGTMIDRFLEMFTAPTIHAFEPLPFYAEKLIDKYSSGDRVHIYKNALGSDFKRVHFNVLNRPSSSSVFTPTAINHRYHPDEMEVKEVLEVQQVRLDDVLADQKIAILKLDLQGYELEALKGAVGILDKIRIITTEVEFLPLYDDQPLFAEIDYFLREHGFYLLNLYELWTQSDGQLTAGDAVYLNSRYYHVE